MGRFLSGIEGVHSAEQLEGLLLVLYKGYGVLEKDLVDKYCISIFESKEEKDG